MLLIRDEGMKVVDLRLDRMIEIAQMLDVTLDLVVKTIGRADQSAFAAVSDNPDLLPKYIKSNVRP